ncbi:putative Ig domain-containing protein [Methanosarcina mazei]|nr:putative Ig domain-containing protein [Methanosarcina mazei]
MSNNILVTYSALGYETHDITLEDIDSYNAYPGAGALIGTGTSKVTFVNYSSTNDGTGITSLNSLSLKAINITVLNSTNGVSFTKDSTYNKDVENATIIDSKLLNQNYADILLTCSTNSKFINSKYVKLKLDNRYESEATFYYYNDILVNDNNSKPVNSATILFTNEVTGALANTNGYGDEVSSFKTLSNGKTPSPINNRVESTTISEYYIKSSGIRQNFSHTATITTPDGHTISLSGVTPDSSWYRPDPNIPTYTITAIIPDSSKGPHIIGFAPAKENPFNLGEKKNFRIWTDEPLTSMEWFVNGSPVHNGSLNYTWTATDRNTTIEFRGSNSNGTVNQVWPLGESPDEPSVPDDNPAQEIQFSPSDSVITLNVSEKTVFSVSPDVFTTKEWYINGYPIQNNTTSMTRCWSTAGTRDVTFKGVGSGEPVSHTWTVNVVEEEKNDEESTESIIAITPEYQIVKPKQSFGLDITVDPSTPITGTQIDFAFNSSMASANSVIEGDLFKQKGASTFFNEGDINSSGGTIKHIYGLIIGTSNVSSPGTFATVNLTAGNRTGMAEFNLSNVLISDANSKSVPYTIANASILIDTAPVMNAICCPKSVDEKSNLAFKISAKDADGDRLTLSASGLPEGASFNRTSGAFAWTPAVGQAGVYTITFKVCDGYLTDFENVTVTVNKLNNPPVINFFEPINGSSFSEGERVGISVNATDAEKQALNYSIKIDGVMYSSDPAYIWETDYSSSGNHTIEVSISDGIDEAKMQHSIYISECHPRYDVNEDGVVNILDITNVSREYETTVSKPYPRYDTNQDGEINILDLTLVGHHFGEKVE